MKDDFEDYVFRELVNPNPRRGNLIKAGDIEYKGPVKVSVEEDSHDGVKIVLKKDRSDNIREIKFVCSCGQTKSIILDYTE